MTHATHADLGESNRAFAVWLTGLSGSGKSSLACELEQRLSAVTSRVIVLDGDKLRTGLCRDLGFGLEDRKENMRRAAEVAKLFVDAGWIVIAALISPMREDREAVRNIVGEARYIEVYCECTLDACERRDAKGLYQLARAGEIAQFTGISSPYEVPVSPALVLDTETQSVTECAGILFDFIRMEQMQTDE